MDRRIVLVGDRGGGELVSSGQSSLGRGWRRTGLSPACGTGGLRGSDQPGADCCGGGGAARGLVPLAVSRLGLLRSYRISFVALAASGPLWVAAGRSLPALTAWACLLGAGYGAFVGLSPAVAADVLGTAALGRRLGALYTSAGVGALAGPLFAGAAIEMTGGYLAAIALAASAGAVDALAVRSSSNVVFGIGC